MTSQFIGMLGILATFLLIFMGVPIGFAFALVGGVGICTITSITGGLGSMAIVSFDWASHYTFSCIPMFVLMGLIIAHSGLATELFFMGYKWLGRLRGSLAIATIVGCGFFGAVSGSASATAATMGTICYPEMRKYGYDPALASGAAAVGATMDTMIPPSIPMVLYGLITDASIGKLFVASFVPGILEIFFFSLTVWLITLCRPALAPARTVHYSMREKLRSLFVLVPVLLIFLLVLGGLYGGIFTPTEAGACGAIGAVLVSLAMRRFSWRGAGKAMVGTLRITGMILVLVIGAMIFNNFIAMSGLAGAFCDWINALQLSPLGFVGLVLFLYLPLGALMDEAAMLLLTIPIYLPTLRALGIDLIWFGILVMMSWQIGAIAPPVGLIAFIIQGVTKEPSLGTVFKGCIPFILALIAVTALLLMFPDLSLFMVSRME